LSDTLKHVQVCLDYFRQTHNGRSPETDREVFEIKQEVQQMDMIHDAMMDPEFHDEETDWLEA
jgi:hypothetical protein